MSYERVRNPEARERRERTPEKGVDEEAFRYALSAQPYPREDVRKPRFTELTGGLERTVLMTVEMGPEIVPLLDPVGGLTILSMNSGGIRGRYDREEIAKVTEGSDNTNREDEESLAEYFFEHPRSD